MDFNKLVTKRHSCKKYDGRKVDREALQMILEAGRLAPTAKNLQPQRVYVVESEKGLAAIDKCTPCRYNAGTCLVVSYDTTELYTYPGTDRTSGVEDATIVATHMMLAAASLGVDSCWLNRFNPQELKAELSLPEQEEIVMILDLGYAAADCPASPNQGKRKPQEETVKYI